MSNQIPIINIIASTSNSGKTTLLEKLVPELMAKGLEIAVLKGHSKQIDLDKPGKDTWKYIESGATMAGIVTPHKFMITGQAEDHRQSMIKTTEILQGVDLVLVEGDKKSDNPKIEIINEMEQTEPTGAENIIAVVTEGNLDNSFRQKNGQEFPVFHMEEVQGIANFIYSYCFENDGHREDSTEETSPDSLTHFDPAGRPRMVDVSAKDSSTREAVACGEVLMSNHTLERVKEGTMSKGDVLGVAQVAAVMGVKETGRLIPMAHPLGVSAVEVDFNYSKDELHQDQSKIEITVKVKFSGQTGVEMEALTGVSVAALTIYDMCKAIDKEMVIQNIRLEEKKGGRSGHYRRGKE